MYLTEEMKERLVQAVEAVDKAFKGQHQYYKRYVAVSAVKYGKAFDGDKVKELMQFIRKNTGVFSPFRVNVFVLASLLYLGSKRPEDRFIRIRDHLKLLKEKGFKKSRYLPMMSYTLDSIMFDDKVQDMAIQTESYRNGVVEKAKLAYDEMKRNHPWITGGEDYPLALLIAHGDKSSERIESIYSRLNGHGFKKGNELQNLANILAVSDEDERTLIDKAVQMERRCREREFKIKPIMYAGLGIMALVDDETDPMDKVIGLSNELRKMKKFKWLDRNLLFMFAVLLVSEEVKKELSGKTIMESTLSITIEQLVLAQTAVMVSVITASTSASTAASS